MSGLLDVDGLDPATARFALADGAGAVLVDETSPAYLGGLPDVLAATGSVLPLLSTPTAPARVCPMPPTAPTRSPGSRR